MTWTDIRSTGSAEAFQRGRRAVGKLLEALRWRHEPLALDEGDPSFLTFRYQSSHSNEKVIFQTQNNASANHRTIVAFKEQNERTIFVFARNLIFNGIGATRHHDPFGEPALVQALENFDCLMIPADPENRHYGLVAEDFGHVARPSRYLVVCLFDEDGSLVDEDGQPLNEQRP